MPRVDFYITNNTGRNGQLLLACRVTEKAYQLGNSIYIRADTPNQASQIDDLLWTFKQGSFIPHGRQGDNDTNNPVVIGYDQSEPDKPSDVLINLTNDIPAFYKKFERVAEVIGTDEPARKSARERYRLYREQGCELNTHNV